MKNTGVCPKCNSTNIVVPDSMGAAQGNIGLIHIPLGIFKQARISHYICCGCGFIEQWVKDENDLKAIETKHYKK